MGVSWLIYLLKFTIFGIIERDFKAASEREREKTATGIKRDRDIERQTETTGRQTDRQTDRQIETQTDRLKKGRPIDLNLKTNQLTLRRAYIQNKADRHNLRSRKSKSHRVGLPSNCLKTLKKVKRNGPTDRPSLRD